MNVEIMDSISPEPVNSSSPHIIRFCGINKV